MRRRAPTFLTACLSLAISTLLPWAAALAQSIYEFDGTVVGMSSGVIGIRDLRCRVHGLTVSGTTAVWNGRPFHLYDASYAGKNVHVVAVHHELFDDLVSAHTRGGPSAPKNCTSYSTIRQLEGVLTAYSMSSSLESFTVKVDTGDDVTFPFSNSDERPRFFGNRRITDGLPACVVFGKTRVVVRYHAAMDVNGHRAEVVAVDRARSR